MAEEDEIWSDVGEEVWPDVGEVWSDEEQLGKPPKLVPYNKGKQYNTVPHDVKIVAFNFILENRDRFGWGPNGSNNQKDKDRWQSKLLDKVKEETGWDLEWRKVSKWFSANKKAAQEKNLHNSKFGNDPKKLTKLEDIADQVCSLITLFNQSIFN